MTTEICGCHNVTDDEINRLLDLWGHENTPLKTLGVCQDCLQDMKESLIRAGYTVTR